MKLSHKKSIFTALLLSAFVCICLSLGVIWRDEPRYAPAEVRVWPVALTGVYRVDDGPEKPLPADGRLEVSGRCRVAITGQLTRDIPSGQKLIMRSDNLRIHLKLNGRELYSFGDPSTLPTYAHAPGNAWKSVLSPGMTTQDVLEIELENVYTNHVQMAYRLFLTELHSGYEAELIAQELQQALPKNMLGMMVFCFGLIALFCCVVLLYLKKSASSAFCLAMLAIFSGLWFLIGFDVRCYYVRHPIWINCLDILSLMMMSAFLMLYFAANLRTKWRWGPLGAAGLWLGLVVVSTITQLTGVADYYAYSAAIMGMGILGIVVLLISCLREWQTHRDTQAKMLLLPMAFICAGVLADLLCNRLTVWPHVIWYKVGFTAFMLLQVYQMMRSIQQILAENISMQAIRAQSEKLTRVLEYQELLAESTRGLYENIYEIDITHNCAGSENTRLYFKTLGVPGEATADEALEIIARKQIKPEFFRGYVEMFSTAHAKAAFADGTDSLRYDFQISADGLTYYWMRITARIFYWHDDDSVRMISYRQNIDAEKRRELDLREKLQRDPLTDLYNKVATEALICDALNSYRAVECRHAFLILDIDNFKQINDTYGHAVGDAVIQAFAARLRSSFRESDIVGRIGGDEFAVFLPIRDRKSLEKQAEELSRKLKNRLVADAAEFFVSASIGVACTAECAVDFDTLYHQADEALYRTKKCNKGGFTIYTAETD